MSGNDYITEFANGAQQASLGAAVSAIEAPGVKVELFTSGIKLTRDNRQITVFTDTGLVQGPDGQTSVLSATNSKGEMDAFKRQSQGAYAFGKCFGDSLQDFALYTTTNKSFVRFGEKAVLFSNLDEQTGGIALYQNDILSAGEVKMTAPAPAPRIDRDSPLAYAAV